VIADAAAEGLIARSGVATGDTKPGEKAVGEPLAEWERDLLEGEKKEDTAEAVAAPAAEAAEAPIETSAETEKVADAEQAEEAAAPAADAEQA
jgi:small subunit ribosomal protein S2